MRKLDIFDWIADYVGDNEMQNGEEILLSLDGRDICKAVVVRDDEPDNYEMEFKVIPLR